MCCPLPQDGSRREVNLIPNAQIEDQLFNQLADKKVDVVPWMNKSLAQNSWVWGSETYYKNMIWRHIYDYVEIILEDIYDYLQYIYGIIYTL